MKIFRPTLAALVAICLVGCRSSVVVSGTSTSPHVLNASKAATVYCLRTQGQGQGLEVFRAGTSNQVESCSRSSGNGTTTTLPVFARYAATGLQLGWDYLEVGTWSTNTTALYNSTTSTPPLPPPASDNVENWKRMGFMEGYLTAHVIRRFLPTSSWAGGGRTPGEKKWVSDHLAYINASIAANASTSKYWNQVQKLFAQMQGIAEGYNARFLKESSEGSSRPFGSSSAAHPPPTLSFLDVFLQNFRDDLGDVARAVKVQNAMKKQGNNGVNTTPTPSHKQLNKLYPPHLHQGMHCSAFIKPTSRDLFVAQDTWSGYPKLANRIYKKYTLDYNIILQHATGRQITFSGIPAIISSQDDWYQILDTTQGVAMSTLETTNFVFNSSLYTAVVPETVSETIRVMTANWLTSKQGGGQEWTSIFSHHNSGTYNNQWMVVDFNKFTPGLAIQADTLWVAEQIPGLILSRDVSDVVQQQGYWASYNTPFFPEIYELSGYLEKEQEEGDFWSYTKYARPEIFLRNHTDAVDLPSVMRLMRYNNYQNDHLSLIPNCTRCATKHSSMLSIASRGDLMAQYNTTNQMIDHYGQLYSLMAQSCFGAVDSKIAAWSQRHKLENWAVCGPTNDQQSTYKWGEAGCPRPEGAPLEYDFPWLQVVNHV